MRDCTCFDRKGQTDRSKTGARRQGGATLFEVGRRGCCAVSAPCATESGRAVRVGMHGVRVDRVGRVRAVARLARVLSGLSRGLYSVTCGGDARVGAVRISRQGLRGHASAFFRGIPSMGAEERAERCLRREAGFSQRRPMDFYPINAMYEEQRSALWNRSLTISARS